MSLPNHLSIACPQLRRESPAPAQAPRYHVKARVKDFLGGIRAEQGEQLAATGRRAV